MWMWGDVWVGWQSTYLLGRIDDASVIAKLQGSEHCSSHSQQEAARHFLQRKKSQGYRHVWAQSTTEQSQCWQGLMFRCLAWLLATHLPFSQETWLLPGLGCPNLPS